MPARSSPSTAAELARLVTPFLPPPAVDYVGDLLGRHQVDLRISRPRRTKLGDIGRPTGPWPATGSRSTTTSIPMPS